MSQSNVNTGSNNNVSQGKNLDQYGVQKIYPDAAGQTQVYMGIDPDKSIFNVSYGGGSHIPFTKKTEGSLTFFNTAGSPIKYNSGQKAGRSTRIDTYPGGGMWANKTKFWWKSNPGYLYNEKGIKNGEYTTFIRVHGDLGTHQAYAHKIGGRDDDSLRSLMEMVYPTATHGDIQVNYNYAHFPYVNAKPKILKAPSKLVPEKWIGVKTIHIVAKDGKSTHWEMWVDENPFDSQGKPQNNWVLAATYEDHGCKEYGNVPLTWRCHKDVCRVDGFSNVDFALFSDREIDVNAIPVPTPTPTPSPQPGPTPTPNPSPTPTPEPQPGPIINPPIVNPEDDEDEAKEAAEYMKANMDFVKQVVKENPQLAEKLNELYQIDVKA